jgi:hypothetical protein
MAGLRMMVVALAACGSADAQPTAVQSGITAPAGWQALPAAAAAAKTAAGGTGVTVDGVEAWGEPAKGCYAVWIQLHGGGDGADALGAQILEGLAAEKITASQQPGDGFALAIERAPSASEPRGEQVPSGYKGTLRAQLGDGKITALACVANQREPASCEAGCKSLLGAVP